METVGRETDGALDAEVLVLGAVDEVTPQTFSRFLTLREVRVMRILWFLVAGTLERSLAVSLATCDIVGWIWRV